MKDGVGTLVKIVTGKKDATTEVIVIEETGIKKTTEIGQTENTTDTGEIRTRTEIVIEIEIAAIGRTKIVIGTTKSGTGIGTTKSGTGIGTTKTGTGIGIKKSRTDIETLGGGREVR